MNTKEKSITRPAYHPYYDVIVAWAQGKNIQFRKGSGSWLDIIYNPIEDSPNFRIDNFEYRIKPKMSTEIEYRLALMRSYNNEDCYVYAINSPEYDDIKSNPSFIEWIGPPNYYTVNKEYYEK